MQGYPIIEKSLQQQLAERIKEIVIKERKENFEYDYNINVSEIKWNGYAYVLILCKQGKNNIHNIQFYKEVEL